MLRTLLKTDYSPHEILTGPARHRPELWRLALGLVGGVFAYLSLSQVWFTVMQASSDDPVFLDDLLSGRTPAAMLVLLGSFAWMTLAVALVARLVHQRSLLSVIGPFALAFPQFLTCLKVLILLLAALYLLPPWGGTEDMVAHLPPGQWLALLPLSLAAVLIQSSAEEIVFRGYLQQQLAARFASPWVWIGVPSAMFAFGHYDPGMAGENAMIIAVWAGIFGMLMADLTARAGSLGPAIAVHFVTNVTAIVVTSLPDDLSGLALYVLPYGADDVAQIRDWMPVEFAIMLVFWLAARLAIRR